MALYRISLLAAGTDSPRGDGKIDCEHDGLAAIDHAGAFDHPHEIHVWEGERLVAHFPSETGLRSPFSP